MRSRLKSVAGLVVLAAVLMPAGVATSGDAPPQVQ